MQTQTQPISNPSPGGSSPKSPAEGSEWLQLSASELARRIRSGAASSREICQAHIDRIRQINPIINAVVADRFDEALAEADRADRRVREASSSDELPAFHGVPCTIKESFALAGMPNTAGLLARKGKLAEVDAVTVARLRAAGAIPMGVTNVSELCMWMESNNKVYGRCSNPYDPSRIAGGSSGGEGAIVGAGASPFGLGADVGGSIRGPAFFNGVFGHKPSSGLVPNTGQYPVTEGEGLRYLATGPIARRAEDLFPLLRVLAGPDGQDTVCRETVLRDPATVDVSGLEVLCVRDNGRLSVSQDLREAQDRAAAHLRACGAQVRELVIPGLSKSLEIWSALMSDAADTSFSELLGEGVPIDVGAELLRWTLGRSPHTFPALGLALLERIVARLPEQKGQMAQQGRELKDEINELLGDDSVLLYPPYTRPAPRHRMPILRPIDWIYTAIFNALELPVTQVPLGLNQGGLPLGVQVVGSHGSDHLTLAVALELELGPGGWSMSERF